MQRLSCNITLRDLSRTRLWFHLQDAHEDIEEWVAHHERVRTPVLLIAERLLDTIYLR